MLKNFNFKQNKTIIIIGIVITIGIIIYFFNNNQLEKSNINDEILVSNNISKEKSTNNEEENIIVIHITGAVKIPGVVRLTEGARIEDAINKAGGLTEDANIANVNLAYVLEDGTKIKIPSITDEITMEESIINTDGGEGVTDSSNLEKNKTAININKADELELQRLQGIGPSLASKIIDYRNNNGNFASIEDIKKVSGIGDSIFENIKENIYVK